MFKSFVHFDMMNKAWKLIFGHKLGNPELDNYLHVKKVLRNYSDRDPGTILTVSNGHTLLGLILYINKRKLHCFGRESKGSSQTR